MEFYAVLDQVHDLLRVRGRISYPAIKEQFGLTDEQLAAVRAELLFAHASSVAGDDRGLTWTAGRPAPIDAERRQLTVLFCDLVDSTPLSRQLDPEDMREVMRAYYETCGQVIERFGGYIAQYLGDGLLIFFGYPEAHEDDAQRAVRAGLKMIDAVKALDSEIRVRYGVELTVRVGCHTGLVVVGEVVGEARHEMMAMGDTPNVAARLQGVAAPNTLVVGPVTYQLLGGYFDCRSLGTPPLKGVTAPLEVHQVLRESAARTRLDASAAYVGFTPLVGRRDELKQLRDRWADALAGNGQAVLVNGEAGIGKSRLVHALTEQVAVRHAWLTACQGSPYHQDTAFYPFVDLFDRVVLHVAGSESAADKLQKLKEFFEQSGLPLGDALPGLCSLLSISAGVTPAFAELPADQQKRQSMEAVLNIVRRRAEQQPVVLIIEDLHWVDPTTIDLLGFVVDRIQNARLLALFTCRPEFHNPWTGRPNVTEMTLDRLPPNEAVEMLHRVTNGNALPDEIVADVVDKTDGVPLFIEELTKTLLETGLLEEKAGRYEVAGPLPPLAIPNTLHDSLMARLDRLATTKSLAQLGAAIGREFSYTLLRAVSPWSEELLADGLQQLVRAEFLHQQGALPKATYRFKHALIQDAAYQSLLKSTRQQHHQRIASTMESEFPETVATQPELLAQHYTEAGLTEHAVPYWHAAADRALGRHANQEATNHASRGLTLLASLGETPARAKQELELSLVLGAAKSFVTGPGSVDTTYARARELARQVGTTTQLFPALAGMAYAQIVHGHMREARTLAAEFLELAESVQDPLVYATGHWLMAYTAWWQGDILDVRRHSRRCLEFYDPKQHRDGIATYNNNAGVVCGYLDPMATWVLGYPMEATQAMERAVAHARQLEHPQSLSVTLLFAAQLSQFRRDAMAAKVSAEQALAISTEHGFHAISLWCLLPRGWALVQQGEVAAGIADFREAMERRRAFGMGAVWPWYLALAAEAYGADEQFEDGLRALDEAMQWVCRNGERLYEAEVHRIRGELLLRRPAPDPARAEACFVDALCVAREQEAKSWELRAATSLARMRQEFGRREDARALLEPIYLWFTEGFDTADLQDAKALLEQVS
jgi:class 3 adenylate cyclase/predicted ATPase